MHASSMDPDQTAPYGAVWSGSTLLAFNALETSKAQQQWAKQMILVVNDS